MSFERHKDHDMPRITFQGHLYLIPLDLDRIQHFDTKMLGPYNFNDVIWPICNKSCGKTAQLAHLIGIVESCFRVS